jgi:hypothetical protein
VTGLHNHRGWALSLVRKYRRTCARHRRSAGRFRRHAMCICRLWWKRTEQVSSRSVSDITVAVQLANEYGRFSVPNWSRSAYLSLSVVSPNL